APFYPDFLYLRIILAFVHFIGQVFRKVDMEYLGQHRALRFSGDRLDTRYDRHIDPLFPAFLHEIEVLFVVEEHLGDDIFRTKVHLQYQVLQVGLEIRGAKMLLRIASHTNAKICWRRLLQSVVEVYAAIHSNNLFEQLRGILMTTWLRYKPRLGLYGVSL